MLAYRYILKVCHAEPRQLVTFADMLKCVLAHDRNHRPNRHWETAYEYCDICNVNYSYIIRTENMMEEGAYVMDQAGLDNSKRILNVVRGGTIREVEKRKPRPHSDYYKDIDIEIINRLQGIYEWELKLFNYPHTPFTN
ncbi:carbohydrate sulfotransferase 11-like [Watersipora subatra]